MWWWFIDWEAISGALSAFGAGVSCEQNSRNANQVATALFYLARLLSETIRETHNSRVASPLARGGGHPVRDQETQPLSSASSTRAKPSMPSMDSGSSQTGM